MNKKEISEQLDRFEAIVLWLERETERVPKRPLTTSGWRRLSEIHARHLQLQRRYNEFLQKNGITDVIERKKKL